MVGFLSRLVVQYLTDTSNPRRPLNFLSKHPLTMIRLDATKKPYPLIFGNNEPVPPAVRTKPISDLDHWELRIRFMAAIQENDLVTTAEILKEHFSSGRFEPDECYAASESISAICVAIERGFLEMVQLLIDYGCSVNRYTAGFSPLHYAAVNGSPEIIKLLLKERANHNALSDHGNTALQLACQTKSPEAVDLLIKAGSNIEKANPDGQTPLAIACMNNRIETAELLIKYGADVNSVDNRGNTPLLLAIDQFFTINHLLVKLLLDAGANPDHMNNNDTTEIGFLKQNAIHVAISRGQDRIIEMLIRAGCDLNISGVEGFTPLERLCFNGNYNMVNLILAAGAKPELSKSAIERLGQLRGDESYTLQSLVIGWSNKAFSLQHLCRVKLRQHWNRHADEIISNHLFIPASMERFLLLMNL